MPRRWSSRSRRTAEQCRPAARMRNRTSAMRGELVGKRGDVVGLRENRGVHENSGTRGLEHMFDNSTQGINSDKLANNPHKPKCTNTSGDVGVGSVGLRGMDLLVLDHTEQESHHQMVPSQPEVDRHRRGQVRRQCCDALSRGQSDTWVRSEEMGRHCLFFLVLVFTKGVGRIFCW